MLKKILCVIFMMLTAFSFASCSKDKRIDKAALAETVSVTKGQSGFDYTFFLIGSAEKPQKATVSADNFKEACALAKKESIPNLSLSKTELLVFDKAIPKIIFENDLKYISTESEFSPLLQLCLADSSALEYLSENKAAPEKIEELILLSKSENSFIKTDCLSVYNSRGIGEVFVPQISGKPELSVNYGKIY